MMKRYEALNDFASSKILLHMAKLGDLAVPKESGRVAKLKAELAQLRQQSGGFRALEQRCRQAEKALKALQERNQLLGDSAPFGIFTVDRRGFIRGITRKMLEMLSWPTKDYSQPGSLSDTLFPAQVLTDIGRCMTGGKPLVVEHPFSNSSGMCSLWRYYLSPVLGTADVVEEVMVFVQDCTELMRSEKALQASEMRYRQLFQSAPIALIERDASQLKIHLEQLRQSGIGDLREYLEENPSRVHYCWSLIRTSNYNSAYLELMGRTDGSEARNEALPFGSKRFQQMALEIILAIAEGCNANERELSLVTPGGESKFVLGRSLVVSGHEERMDRVLVALVDISRRKELENVLQESEQRFRNQAFRDGLTGLFNQRYLYRSLPELLERAQATATPLSVIFMDLDHFKLIVDRNGHLNGSRAIRKVAHTINQCLNEPAYAVAYAGDEFVVVLPGMDRAQALQKASEIRELIKNTVYELEPGVKVMLKASFGTATWPEHAEELNGLLAAADQALFTIKAAGKDAIGQYQSLPQPGPSAVETKR